MNLQIGRSSFSFSCKAAFCALVAIDDYSIEKVIAKKSGEEKSCKSNSTSKTSAYVASFWFFSPLYWQTSVNALSRFGGIVWSLTLSPNSGTVFGGKLHRRLMAWSWRRQTDLTPMASIAHRWTTLPLLFQKEKQTFKTWIPDNFCLHFFAAKMQTSTAKKLWEQSCSWCKLFFANFLRIVKHCLPGNWLENLQNVIEFNLNCKCESNHVVY